MVSIPFLHCEDFVTGVEVDQWLGCHGYLLSITSLANHLICCTAPTCSLQWSIDKLISFYLFVGILLLFLVFFLCMCLSYQNMITFLLNAAMFFWENTSPVTEVIALIVFKCEESYKTIWSTAIVGGIPQNYEKLCGDLYNLKHKQLKAFVIIIITKIINISHGY